jgi:CP12 domain
MENIQQHIDHDKKILDDPTISPQMRRHTQGELNELEAYQSRHPEDDHDPTSLELYCDAHPDALECKVYDD